MNTFWIGLLWVAVAYLLGGIPFGYLLVRFRRGSDIRKLGSGNTGATNVARTSGWTDGLITLLLDAAKGYLAVTVAALLTHRNLGFMALSAGSAVLGHVFPIYLRLRGGKGVATSVGVFFALATLPTAAALLIFLVILAIWRFVSLASVLAAASFPVLYFLIDYSRQPSLWVLLAAIFSSGLVILRHHENIKRLVLGTENRLRRLKK